MQYVVVSMICIRPETQADIAAVHTINVDAFTTSELGYSGEAEIVDELRSSHPQGLLSLVAEAAGKVVGHILFSPVTIGEQDVIGMGLGPMAVTPACQRAGIGSQLIEDGIKQLRNHGTPFIVVLGHPQYYSRFGFRRASAQGIHCEYDGVPDEAFMVLVLEESFVAQGAARYLPEFGDVT